MILPHYRFLLALVIIVTLPPSTVLDGKSVNMGHHHSKTVIFTIFNTLSMTFTETINAWKYFDAEHYKKGKSEISVITSIRALKFQAPNVDRLIYCDTKKIWKNN